MPVGLKKLPLWFLQKSPAYKRFIQIMNTLIRTLEVLRYFVFVWLGCFLLQTNCFAATLEQFTSTHTRVVWVQEQGKGTDTFALGENLMLMGYDSRDGKKEKPLLPETGNFYKSFFTPDGQKIVVSNRRLHEIYLVDFDHGGKKMLGKGVAVDVWQDPETGKVWVYALAGDGPENKYFTTHPLIRFPLDHPGQRETVWDKTHLSWSNFDMSRDGKFAGGLFPWPHAGILLFEKNKWKQYGKGCWTALSPDNSAILWFFDGLHRNLNFVNPFTAEFWSTNINNAPGIGGYEVYHPRWSNHVRFLTMTGPYVEGEGGNKITGGGQKVEVYVGRFSPDLKKVEDWFQLTHNDRADFYPEVWLENGRTSNFSTEPQGPATLVSDPNALEWPSGKKNLVFVWQDVLAENKLDETSPLGFNQFRVTAKNSARFNRFLEMDLHGAGFVADWPAKKVADVFRNNQTMSLELLFTPKATGIEENGPVVQIREKGKTSAVILLQQGENLVLKISTPGQPVVWETVSEVFKPNLPVHLFIDLQKEAINIYVDGRKLVERVTRELFFTTSQDVELFFGQTEASAKGIHGAISHVALYSGAISEKNRAGNVRIVTGELEARKVGESFSFTGELIEGSKVPAPDDLGAYRRALVVNRYKILDSTQKNISSKEILVAQWAVLDREVLPETEKFSIGYTTELKVEKFDEHPELEGERLMMDMFDPDLDFFYQVDL